MPVGELSGGHIALIGGIESRRSVILMIALLLGAAGVAKRAADL
jgi:hypothetical protein